MDFSTINLDALRSLPTYVVPDSYSVQHEPGNGCAGDPPGFPSYFTRSVYTKHGNNPRKGAELVIRHEGTLYVIERAEWTRGDTWEQRMARRNELLLRLWKPLPYEHARVQCWIRETYRHHAHCYRDDAGLVADKHDNGMIIAPTPSYKLRAFCDDARFSDEWRAKERAAVEAFNADLRARTAQVAVPANHGAYRIVSRYYPEHRPDLALIANPPEEVGGMWWESEAAQPAPEACHPRWGRHPQAGVGWCQWCDWRKEPDEVQA